MFCMDQHIDSKNDVLDKFCFYLCTFIYAFKLTFFCCCCFTSIICSLATFGKFRKMKILLCFFIPFMANIFHTNPPTPLKKKETPITYHPHHNCTVASQVSFWVNMHLGKKRTQWSCSQFQSYFHSTFLATFQYKCGKRWVDISSCICWIRLAAYKTKPMWRAV